MSEFSFQPSSVPRGPSPSSRCTRRRSLRRVASSACIRDSSPPIIIRRVAEDENTGLRSTLDTSS